MKTIENILTSGLAKQGNGFKIELSKLAEEANMAEIETIIALNTIKYDAWNMVTY